MNTNLDALLTELYVHLDDDVLPRLGWSREHRRGRKPRLSDTEVLCLTVAQHLLGIASERRWVRFAHQHLRGLFPYLPGQSGYSKRIRSLGGLTAAALSVLAREVPSFSQPVRLLDSTPLPCAASRETVKRSLLAEVAAYSYSASHSRYYWGMRCYLLSTPEGMPVSWALATPKLDEREVARALLEEDAALLAPGQVIIADKGFASAEFERFMAEYPGVRLLRPDRRNEPRRFGSLGKVRQWIESVFDTLKGQLTLEQHGGRTLAGVYARVAGRLLALGAAIWRNWRVGALHKRSLIAYDH